MSRRVTTRKWRLFTPEAKGVRLVRGGVLADKRIIKVIHNAKFERRILAATRRPLSVEQVAYAAADVEVLIELAARMRTALPLLEAGL